MNNERKCHCDGDLRLYEDPLASKMLADYETDSFNVRNVLLECLAILGVKNVAAADECRTRDVADLLKTALATAPPRTKELSEQVARLKTERDGALHSSECWELLHAKRHEEAEALTKERDGYSEGWLAAIGRLSVVASQRDKALALVAELTQQHNE